MLSHFLLSERHNTWTLCPVNFTYPCLFVCLYILCLFIWGFVSCVYSKGISFFHFSFSFSFLRSPSLPLTLWSIGRFVSYYTKVKRKNTLWMGAWWKWTLSFFFRPHSDQQTEFRYMGDMRNNVLVVSPLFICTRRIGGGFRGWYKLNKKNSLVCYLCTLKQRDCQRKNIAGL